VDVGVGDGVIVDVGVGEGVIVEVGVGVGVGERCWLSARAIIGKSAKHDVISKAVTTLLSARFVLFGDMLRTCFIVVFLCICGFSFRVMFVICHLFPEIRGEVRENVLNRLNFFNPPSPRGFNLRARLRQDKTARQAPDFVASRKLRRLKTAKQTADGPDLELQQAPTFASALTWQARNDVSISTNSDDVRFATGVLQSPECAKRHTMRPPLPGAVPKCLALNASIF
jgi:hypothetical protein